MAEYGYLCHSLLDDRDDRAIEAVFAAVPGERIVIEQNWTRGETVRPAFEKLMQKLRPGDVLYLSSVDRLGLDKDDIVRQWKHITRDIGADIVVLNDPRLNSRTNKQLTMQTVGDSAQTEHTYAAGTPRRGKPASSV